MRDRSSLVVALLLPFLLMLGVPASTPSLAASPQQSAALSREVGLNLDVARRYWSLAAIKTMVDRLASAGGTYLHLHVSDDQAYGIESPLLGQTAAEATVTGTRYTNPATGKPFLTTAQLREIEGYAGTRGIDTFLEIDTPGHMRAIRELMEHRPHTGYPVSEVFSDYGPYELDVHSPTARRFAKALYTEAAGLLAAPSRLHIGGDEFAGGAAERVAWAAYANDLTGMLRARGLGVLAWNDAFTSETLHLLDPGITVTYWNYDVWGEPGTKARLPEVTQAGFRVLNYNGYYCYWVPSLDEPQSDRDYTINDLRTRWHRGMYSQTGATGADDPRIAGSAFSIWGEDSAGMSDAMLIERGSPILDAFASRAREP